MRIKRSLSGNGVLNWTASPQHTICVYEARLRQQGSSTVVDTYALGRPNTDANNQCHVDIKAWLNSHASGNYDVSVAAITGTGSTDSVVSSDFAIPIP